VENRSHAAIALRLLSIGIGIFFVAMSAQKGPWLFESDVLSTRLQASVPEAAPLARWYLETVAIPGAAILQRIVPIAELFAGIALILGIRTRAASALAMIMVLNFHVATGTLFTWDILKEGSGPPLVAGLLALTIAGQELPFALVASRRSHTTRTLASPEPHAYTELS
jgi:uncharacterized membrane protein YphA (DoxX/SURF4 family)